MSYIWITHKENKCTKAMKISINFKNILMNKYDVKKHTTTFKTTNALELHRLGKKKQTAQIAKSCKKKFTLVPCDRARKVYHIPCTVMSN